MKNNRLCAGVALLLCLTAVPMGAQLNPSERTGLHALALGPLLMSCALVPTVSLIEAMSARPSQPDDAGRMSVMQRFIRWARGAKRAARFYWRVGLPFAFFVEGLGHIADRSDNLVAGGILAASLSALVTALVYKLHISIDEQLAHWFIKLDALLGLDMENEERDHYLYECVGDNRIHRVKALLAHGANPNYVGWPRTTLQSAIRTGNPDMLATVLAHGAQIGDDDLVWAITEGSAPMVVDQLCRAGAAVDVTNTGCEHKVPPLLIAIERCDKEIIQLLAQRGAVLSGRRRDEAVLQHMRFLFPGYYTGLIAVDRAVLARKQCIEQSLDQHNVPKDVAGLVMSFSEQPEALSLFKQHKQVCDMLE